MASGTTLIAVQFLLQHTFGFRQMGVTQAVLWNLLLFVPATMLVNMAIFCLQRRGVVSFYSYGISNDAVRVEESENIDSEEGTVDSRKGTENSEKGGAHDEVPAMGNDISRHIAEAVERWKESGAYREHNLTLSIVAREMGVPAKQLQLWLRQSAYGKFATLVTTLLVEEA